MDVVAVVNLQWRAGIVLQGDAACLHAFAAVEGDEGRHLGIGVGISASGLLGNVGDECVAVAVDDALAGDGYVVLSLGMDECAAGAALMVVDRG